MSRKHPDLSDAPPEWVVRDKWGCRIYCFLALSGRGILVCCKDFLKLFCIFVENILQIQKMVVYLHTKTTTNLLTLIHYGTHKDSNG